MKNKNYDFFRNSYPQHWLANRASLASDEFHTRYQDIMLSRLECFDGCSLLECGSGSGDLLSRLRARYKNIELFGSDLGRKSMIWGRNEFKMDDVNFLESDISVLPIKSNTFDRVLCSSVLWYVPIPEQAIRELVRVLKPGGRIVFDVRPPFHISNMVTRASLMLSRILGKKVLAYSFLSPGMVEQVMSNLPVSFEALGYYFLLPTHLPLLGAKWGNWLRFFPGLSYNGKSGLGRWVSWKLLVFAVKLFPS